MHWVSSRQESKQAVPAVLHVNGLQLRVEPLEHIPAPSQVDSEVAVPRAQRAGRQTVPDAYFLQPPLPSQVPSLRQVSRPASVQTPAGSGPLAGTGEQVPRLPVKLHEKQLAVQGIAQQTPCAHMPISQSDACVHTAPTGRRPQDRFTHTLPAAQSLLTVQKLPQRRSLLHRYGAQVLEGNAEQLPFRQIASSVTRLSTVLQLPWRQTVPIG